MILATTGMVGTGDVVVSGVTNTLKPVGALPTGSEIPPFTKIGRSPGSHDTETVDSTELQK
jgi:hypothetical protein